MPIIGYKKSFKKLNGYQNDIFTVNLDFEYNNHGFLKIKNKRDDTFDVGDYRILLDEVFEKFTDNELKKYDNGVSTLSICKYIVDRIPELYSINYEFKGMIDTYLKQEIIDNYNKIKKSKENK